MAVKVTRTIVPESTISKGRPTKDGKDHATKRILPLLVIESDDPKAAFKAFTEYLATNAAICAGEEVELVTASGAVRKATPKNGNDHQAENVALLPNHDLPTTFADLVDAINAGVEQKHRNQMGAWLTKSFTEPKKGKKDEPAAIADDMEIA